MLRNRRRQFWPSQWLLSLGQVASRKGSGELMILCLRLPEHKKTFHWISLGITFLSTTLSFDRTKEKLSYQSSYVCNFFLGELSELDLQCVEWKAQNAPDAAWLCYLQDRRPGRTTGEDRPTEKLSKVWSLASSVSARCTKHACSTRHKFFVYEARVLDKT